MYFKEQQESLAHEPRLIEVLARRNPALVTEVLVVDECRMLMRDGGTQLSEVLDVDEELRHWERALPLYAQLQIDAAPDADELLRAGAFDRRGVVLPRLYEQLVERVEGLSAQEIAGLRALVAAVRRVAEALAEHAVPETINNDDFTNGSIFVRDGSYRFLDWGDACVSHPFFTLTVSLRVVEARHGLPPGSAEVARLRDAYLEPFTRFEPLERLIPVADEARRFGQICRAALRAENPSWEDSEVLPDLLRLLLDPEIWRTWAE
jgi:Phosphotransferase enzyme family